MAKFNTQDWENGKFVNEGGGTASIKVRNSSTFVSDSTLYASFYKNLGTATKDVVKASPGAVTSIMATNINGTIRYIQLYNGTATPAVGATAVFEAPVNSGASGTPTVVTVDTIFSGGLYLASGISYGISSTSGTLGTANITANEHTVQISYS